MLHNIDIIFSNYFLYAVKTLLHFTVILSYIMHYKFIFKLQLATKKLSWNKKQIA